MKKRVVKIVSGFMLLVFFLGIAPKEYLHSLFFRHHDTVEPILKKGELSIGEKHKHCAFLSFDFGPFVATDRQIITFEEILNHAASYILPAYQFHYSSEHFATSLRGPPYNS